jgi:hypothetical protein
MIYIVSGFVLILIAVLLELYFTRRRFAEISAQLTDLQMETQRRAAAASKAAATAASVYEQLRKDILDLSDQLAREQTQRLDMEERLLRQRPASGISPETPARILTQEQETEAVKTLREFGGTAVSVIEIEDPEAGPLACQITQIARNGGLDVAVSRFGALVPAQYGIICTHGPKEPAAAALVRLLRSFNLLVYDRTGSPDQFEILVGLKP